MVNERKTVKLTRRDFLRVASMSVAGLALASCRPTTTEVADRADETEGELAPSITLPEIGPTSLVFWTVLGNVDGIVMDEMVQGFRREHPDIQVESLQGVEDFEAKLQAAVLTGTGPDITLYRLHYVGPYAARNVVVPLDATLLEAEGVLRENYDARVWDATHYEGQQYAIPLDIHLFALFYNSQVFESAGLDPDQPPATLEDWYDMAKTINSDDVVGTAIYGWPPGMFWIWYGLIKQYGGELFSEDGTRVDLTTPAHIEPTKWWHDLRWDINPDAVNGDLTRTGRVGIWLDGPWTLSLWSDPERSQIVDDYRIAMMPQHDVANPAVWANSHCFSLPRPSDIDNNKMAASIALMKYLSENSLSWSASAGQIPASSVVRESDAWRNGTGKILEGSRQFAEALPHTVFFPRHPMMFEVADRIAAALDAAINTEDVTAEEALQQATEEVNDILGNV